MCWSLARLRAAERAPRGFLLRPIADRGPVRCACARRMRPIAAFDEADVLRAQSGCRMPPYAASFERKAAWPVAADGVRSA
jgi:hypothetical protein